MSAAPSQHPLFVECLAVVGGGGTEWRVHRDDEIRAKGIDAAGAGPREAQAIRFEPHVEQVWPEMHRSCTQRRSSGAKGCQLEYLALPGGVRVREANESHCSTPARRSWDPLREDTSLFSYMLTTRVGTRFHGTALQFWDPMTEAEQKAFWRQAFGDTPCPRVAMQRTTSQLQTLRSLTLLSQFPYTDVAKELLLYIYRSLGEGAGRPIEAVVRWAVNNVYLPKARCTVEIHVGSRVIPLQHSGTCDRGVSVTGRAPNYGFSDVMEAVPLPALVLLLEAALLEKRVVITSRCRSMLASVTATVLDLLHPLRYPHVTVPVLPLFSRMQEALSSPVPFLIGVLQPTEAEQAAGVQPCHPPCDAVVFDIDAENVAVTAPEDEPMPGLPRDLVATLRKGYAKLTKGFAMQTCRVRDYDSLRGGVPALAPGVLPCSHPSFPAAELHQLFRGVMRQLLHREMEAQQHGSSLGEFSRIFHETQIFHMHSTLHTHGWAEPSGDTEGALRTVVIACDRSLEEKGCGGSGGEREGSGGYDSFPQLDKARLGDVVYKEEREMMLSGGDDEAPTIAETWVRLISIIREVERKRRLLGARVEEASKARRLLRTTADRLMSLASQDDISASSDGQKGAKPFSAGRRWIASKLRRRGSRCEDATPDPTPVATPTRTPPPSSTNQGHVAGRGDRLAASGDIGSSSSCGMTSTPREMPDDETRRVCISDDGSIVIKAAETGFAGCESVRLQFDCSSSLDGVCCPQCSRVLDSREADGSAAQLCVRCPCGRQFVPMFSIICKHVATTPQSDVTVMGSTVLQHHLITHSQLLKEIASLHANGVPADTTLLAKHPTTFWNIIRVFREIAVPLEMALPSVDWAQIFANLVQASGG